MHGKRWSLSKHYLNWSFFWLLIFGVIGLFVAHQLEGTKYQFFGPGSRSWAKNKLTLSSPTASGPGYVAAYWFRGRPYIEEEIRSYDLSDGMATYGGIEQGPNWFKWETVIAVNHDGRSKLSPERLAEIQKIADAMPESTSTGPVEDTLCVAVNRHGQFRTYHYQLDFDGKDSFRKVPAQILDLLGF